MPLVPIGPLGHTPAIAQPIQLISDGSPPLDPDKITDQGQRPNALGNMLVGLVAVLLLDSQRASP